MQRRIEGEGLVVGMTLVPRFLSRNRSFALFENPEVRRARVRAALLRGIVGQLAGAQGRIDGLEVVSCGGSRELRYRVPGLRMDRRAVLTEVEYACVAYLAARAGVPGLRSGEEDRARIDASLRGLSAGLRLRDLETGPAREPR
jgi:hypothetical protein